MTPILNQRVKKSYPNLPHIGILIKSIAAINVSPHPSFSFSFSILGLYGLVYYPRFLTPHNVLPYVSAILTEAEHLLDRAESIVSLQAE